MISDFTATPDMVDQKTAARLLQQEFWYGIDVSKCQSPEARRKAHRFNALGSLYYFTKIILRKHRLVEHLHKPICDLLESYHLKEVLEIPRDHFKSTICSESAPIWWALPFTDEDENDMRLLGYGDEWIRWMRRAHNPNTRTLIVSENITNAKKLGMRISMHYENNAFFRHLFPEILPDEKCKWTEESMRHKRTPDATPQGEGTYDFLGVGGALQSRHYDRIVQDDLVGRKALSSEAVMETTIEYHKLLVGAFDSSRENAVEDNDEIIVGNRWSDRDLNYWARENEPYFKFHNHSALGGCCAAHEPGKPIFPEEFSIEKLLRWKARLGTYLFSCQFLNNPTAPGSARFREEYLNWYNFEIVNPTRIGTNDDGSIRMADPRVKIVHETRNGLQIKDIFPKQLDSITMVIDPNHAGSEGRCRHAITVTGYQRTPQRVYLLDCWAESCDVNKFTNKIFQLVTKWKLREVWLETIAAQKYLKIHLDYLKRSKGYQFRVNELKVDRGANAKDNRITSLDPIFENGQFFCRRQHLDFLVEYNKYPHGKTVDILDTLGYAPQTWGVSTSIEEVKAFITRQRNAHGMGIASNSRSITGY